MIAVEPAMIRKAAAFVEAIEKVERDFGVRLGVSDRQVEFRASDWPTSFGILRVAGDEARLALSFPEVDAYRPRFPVHGRD